MSDRSCFDRMPLESDLEREIRLYAERRGWFVLKFVSPGRNHVMDRLMIRHGIVIFPEIKREGEDLRKAQRVRRKQMESYGAKVYKWDNLEEAQRDLY